MSMRNPDDDFDFRQEICAWLSANGISPALTPMHPDPSIADGQITIRQKVQRDGRDVLIPGAFEVLTETITVPLVVAPEGDVATWVHPPCRMCGR